MPGLLPGLVPGLVLGLAASCLPAAAQQPSQQQAQQPSQQQGRQPAQQPSQQQGQQPGGDKQEIPGSYPLPVEPEAGDHPYLKRVRPKDWTFTATVAVRRYDDIRPDGTYLVAEPWRLSRLVLIYPFLVRSASSETHIDEMDAELVIDSGERGFEASVIGPYPGNQQYAKLEVSNVTASTVRAEFELSVTSYQTVFNEAAANRVPWPEGQWPEEAASTLKPQAFIDAVPRTTHGDNPPPPPDAVERLVAYWLGDNDPLDANPVPLAKWLTQKVIAHYRPRSQGLNANSNGELQGFNLRGGQYAARYGEGTPFDLAALTVAAFREVGLPARVVIGYRDDAPDDDFGADLHAWVEFAILDEARDLLTWIPIDVWELRGRGFATHDLGRPTKYFGTHDELDEIVPFAFHFHPPTTVRAFNAPAFYGWLSQPSSNAVNEQAVSFRASRTSKRSGDTPERLRRYGRPDAER